MKKFQIGDVIRPNERGLENWYCLKGDDIGTIVTYCEGSYGIEFQRKCDSFHDLGGYAKSHHGYWIREDEMELIYEDTLDSSEISIDDLIGF